MAVCMACGRDYSSGGELLAFGDTRLKVCSDCAQKAKTNPAAFKADMEKLSATNPSWPVCDACGRRHSDACSIIGFAGQNFNVSGACVPAVEENPADFLAGKKGTEPES